MKHLPIIICLAMFANFAFAKTYYVKPGGSDQNTGTSWAAPLKTVTKAVEKAKYGDEVWVAAGTYKHGRPIAMKNGVSMYGGFAGTEKAKTARSGKNETVLSGENSYRIIHNNGAAGEMLNADTVLDGFTLAEGKNFAEGQPVHGGGAIFNSYASLLVSNCRFINNSSETCAGAVYNFESSPRFIGCEFVNNRSGSLGAAIYNENSSPAIDSCTFDGNVTNLDGKHGSAAAVYDKKSNTRITASTCEGGEELYDDKVYEPMGQTAHKQPTEEIPAPPDSSTAATGTPDANEVAGESGNINSGGTDGGDNLSISHLDVSNTAQGAADMSEMLLIGGSASNGGSAANGAIKTGDISVSCGGMTISCVCKPIGLVSGTVYTIRAAAVGENLKYQWYESFDGVEFLPAEGENLSSMKIAADDQFSGRVYYYCEIRGGQSKTATKTVILDFAN